MQRLGQCFMRIKFWSFLWRLRILWRGHGFSPKQSPECVDFSDPWPGRLRSWVWDEISGYWLKRLDNHKGGCRPLAWQIADSARRAGVSVYFHIWKGNQSVGHTRHMVVTPTKGATFSKMGQSQLWSGVMWVPFPKIFSCADAPLVYASSSGSYLKSIITQAVFGAMSGKIRTP